jgi:hypothetical protein
MVALIIETKDMTTREIDKETKTEETEIEGTMIEETKIEETMIEETMIEEAMIEETKDMNDPHETNIGVEADLLEDQSRTNLTEEGVGHDTR